MSEREGQAAGSEIVVPVEPQEAWEAFTDPERLEQWLASDAEIELRPGGELAIELEDEQRRGFVEEVDAPSRLVFWWSVEDGEASRVAIDLLPDPAGTRVRVVETRPLAELDARGIDLGLRFDDRRDRSAGGSDAPRAVAKLSAVS